MGRGVGLCQTSGTRGLLVAALSSGETRMGAVRGTVVTDAETEAEAASFRSKAKTRRLEASIITAKNRSLAVTLFTIFSISGFGAKKRRPSAAFFFRLLILFLFFDVLEFFFEISNFFLQLFLMLFAAFVEEQNGG